MTLFMERSGGFTAGSNSYTSSAAPPRWPLWRVSQGASSSMTARVDASTTQSHRESMHRRYRIFRSAASGLHVPAYSRRLAKREGLQLRVSRRPLDGCSEKLGSRQRL